MNRVDSVVILGGGLAGANAAFALRDVGFGGDVTLVGDETYLPYKRPPMSKEYLRGEKPIEKAYVKPADAYVEAGIQLIRATRALAVDARRRTVALDNGGTLTYDALVLATGSAPRRLDVPGADLEGVLYLRNVDDADALRTAAMKAGAIAVVGGGWIGTEVAASLRQLGRNVTLMSLPPQPLEHVLGAEVATAYRRVHEENGTRIVIGRVARLDGDVQVGGVLLADGTRIAADLVVAGVGAAPRIELARSAGLDIRDGGVAVNEYLESSAAAVYAVGDIATAWHPRLERHVRVEHWDNAVRQGKAVAANIAGDRQAYERTPYFYSDQFDLGMEYRGFAQRWDEVVIRGDLDAREFDAFWLKNRRVVGAMNANRWDDAAELQDLVDRQAVVDPAELAKARPVGAALAS